MMKMKREMKQMRRVLVLTMIAAVIAVLAVPMIANVHATTYRLRVPNQSSNFEDFKIFQSDPDLGLQEAGQILHSLHP
jgi:hypothetical protein